MKKLLMFALMMAASGGASAQYVPIPYYDNDPFVFCTVGVPWDCWAPIDPALGLFTITDPECYNPISSDLFVAVCPLAFPNGVNSAAAFRRTTPQAIALAAR
jgi:hypothetical protein